MTEAVEICRLCCSREGLMFPIFQSRTSKNETPFRNKIMSCVSIEIFADDNLPSKVCCLCLHQIEKFFQFQTMCETSDSILRSQLKEISNSHEVQQDNNVFLTQNTGTEEEGDNSVLKYNSSNCPEKKVNVSALTCNLCSTVFLSNTFLMDHLINNHPDKNLFFCKICKIAFSYINEYKSHINLHGLTCNYCDSVFKYEKSLKNHLKIHIEQTIACKICGKAYDNFYEMKQHELLHLEKTCSYCCKELDSKDDFNSHSKECDQKYYCKFCNQSFKFKKDLIDHVNGQHDSCSVQKCNNCKDTSVPEEVQEQKYESEEDQSFQCRNCQAQYSDELSLINHMSEEHSDDMLTCKYCAKKFGLRSSLKRHERSHSGIKPYQCKFCPRKFKDSSACVVHTRTHTGEHPFQCQECHKDFKQLANLKMHTYRHHKKNKTSEDMGSEILNEGANDYEHLYSGDIIENYTGDNNMRGYQDLNETMSTGFNQDIIILMPDNH